MSRPRGKKVLKGSSTTAKRTAIPPAPPPPTPATFPQYGIATGYDILTQSTARRNTNLDKIAEVGASMVRFDSTSGNQTQVDAVVAAAATKGLKCLLVLYGTMNGAGPPAVGTFAATQATKWLGNTAIAGFEICNEPDINGWSANNYADFVSVASTAIKTVDPTRVVVAGALWKGGGLGSATDPKAFTVALCTRAAGKFDILSVHLYDDALTRQSWNIWDWALEWGGPGYCDNGANGGTVRKALNDNGHSTVPIISTESGQPLDYPPGGAVEYTQAFQATVVQHAVEQVAAGRIASCSIFQMTNDFAGEFGLLQMLSDTTYNTRLAFGAMQNAIKTPPMPTAALPGWTLIFSDDFPQNVPIGSFPAAVSAKWGAYPDGWTDGTPGGGTYMASRTVSILNGVMDIWQHSEVIGGVTKYLSAVPYPLIGTADNNQLYGRYSCAFRVIGTPPGYKIAFLLWPLSGVWPRDGEIDYPEGDANGLFAAFMHKQGATVGSDAFGFYPGIATVSGWHVATIEWLSTRCTFLLDGVQVGQATTQIPNTKMHWVLQTQVWYGTPAAPSPSAETHVQIGWVTVHST